MLKRLRMWLGGSPTAEEEEPPKRGQIIPAGRKDGELQNVDLPVSGGFFSSTLVEIWKYGQARQRIKAYEKAVNAAEDAHRASARVYDAKIEHRRAWERLQRLDAILAEDKADFDHRHTLKKKKREVETIDQDIALMKKRQELERLERRRKGKGSQESRWGLDPEMEEELEGINDRNEAVDYFYNKMQEEINAIKNDVGITDENEREARIELTKRKYEDIINRIRNPGHGLS